VIVVDAFPRLMAAASAASESVAARMVIADQTHGRAMRGVFMGGVNVRLRGPGLKTGETNVKGIILSSAVELNHGDTVHTEKTGCGDFGHDSWLTIRVKPCFR
jgi:hypothetical protein